jgi:hypothetical protein
VVLGFGPVGGVTGANVSASNATVQVALQDAAASIGQGMVGLVTMTQRIDDGGEALRPAIILSHVGPPLVSPLVAEIVESSRVALPRDEQATIAFVGEQDQGRSHPSTSRQSDLPLEVASTNAGGVAVMAADSLLTADEVAETPSEPSFTLDLAGLPWTSALAAIAAAALTYVAKRRLAQRLGLGRRSDETTRNLGMFLPGHHAMAPRRSILARRRQRCATPANRA